MTHSHTSGPGCNHCSCKNPVVSVLEKKLLKPELLSALSQRRERDAASTPVSQVITGGTIRPLINGSIDPVEAIGIHAGKVVAFGRLAAVEATMKSQGISYSTLQLKEGQTLLPGLIEPHVHIVPNAMTGGWLSLSRIENQRLQAKYDPEWVKTQLQEYIRKANLAKDYWVLAKGVDPSLMPFNDGELITFTNVKLDLMVPDRPLFILSASMHTAYVNTHALRLAYEQLSEDQKKSYDNSFAVYVEKTKGQLQEEVGMTPALKAIPEAQLQAMVGDCGDHLTSMFKEANARGVTFLYDAGMNPTNKKALEKYLEGSPKRVRIGAAWICFTQEDVDALGPYQPAETYSDVYCGHVKVVSDGSNQGLTGYQIDPYDCHAYNPHGLFNFTDPGQDNPTEVPDAYRRLINAAMDKGWPLMIHANGDQAVKFTLQVYDEAISKQQAGARRHRIEHCSLLVPEQITTMRDKGISPSFLIGHVGYWGYAFSQVIFKEKAEQHLDLCRSALNAGLRISLHSDCEVSPLGPLRMMEQSITRIMEAAPPAEGGKPPALNPAERITPEQALRAVTYDAAWQCYADKWVGSLDTGHFADFVILAQDPLTLGDCYLKMRDIPVVETWKDGIRVYSGATAGTK